MRRFLRILRYAKPYRLGLGLGILCVLVVAGVGLITPVAVAFVLGELLPYAAAQFASGGTTLYTWHVPRLGTPVEMESVQWLGLVFAIILGLHALSGFVSFARTYLMSWVGERLLFDIRNQVFLRLQELPMQFYQRRGSGHIMARITGDVDTMGSMITASSIDLLTNTFMVLVIVVYMLAVHWKLALVSFIALPLFATNYHVFVRYIQRVWRALREKWSQMYGELYESIAGAQVVKAFAREKYETRMFFRGMRETYGHSVRLARVGTLMGGVAGLISATGTAVILWYGGSEVIRGHLTLPQLIVFNSYLAYLYGPIVALSTTSQVIHRAMISADRVFDIVDAKSTVEEAPDAVPLPPVEGRVTFDHVSFAYEPEKQVLDDIHFDVEPGTVVALVGPSGSGKTTVANLLPRFYDPTEGHILVDGHDLRTVTLKSLRDQIGIVLQETFLFSGTIKDNLRYGRMDATDQEIVEAAMMANAHDFIVQELPEGYETEVGERGLRLSGGQKQRIAIARAILRNPRILILDEATSSLDSEAEALIQEALERLMKSRTTFIIAHRLSTVMAADVIVVLEEGKMVEIGNHHELVARDGLYGRLYRKQFKIKEPAPADSWLTQ